MNFFAELARRLGGEAFAAVLIAAAALSSVGMYQSPIALCDCACKSLRGSRRDRSNRYISLLG